jgi:hypothetical protein
MHLWRTERRTVLALYDTIRYTFSLLIDDRRVGPLAIPIERDPNYRTQLLQFPASGPGTTFELTRQDAFGKPDTASTWQVEMDPGGEAVLGHGREHVLSVPVRSSAR